MLRLASVTKRSIFTGSRSLCAAASASGSRVGTTAAYTGAAPDGSYYATISPVNDVIHAEFPLHQRSEVSDKVRCILKIDDDEEAREREM